MAYFCSVIINLYFMESTYLISNVSFHVFADSSSRSIRNECRLLSGILTAAYFSTFSEAVDFASNLVRFFKPVSGRTFKVSESEASKLDCTDDEFYFVKLVINVS